MFITTAGQRQAASISSNPSTLSLPLFSLPKVERTFVLYFVGAGGGLLLWERTLYIHQGLMSLEEISI